MRLFEIRKTRIKVGAAIYSHVILIVYVCVHNMYVHPNANASRPHQKHVNPNANPVQVMRSTVPSLSIIPSFSLPFPLALHAPDSSGLLLKFPTWWPLSILPAIIQFLDPFLLSAFATHRTASSPCPLDEVRRLHQSRVFKQLLEFPSHGIE